MVTSFRPLNPLYKDISNLSNVHDSSSWNELFDDWVQSRLTLVQDKISAYKTSLNQRRQQLERKHPGKLLKEPTVDLKEFEEMIKDVSDHLYRAGMELKPYDDPMNVWTNNGDKDQARL